MSETLEDAIRENAEGPKKATGDAGSVEQHDLADRIAAGRYLSSNQAAPRELRQLHDAYDRGSLGVVPVGRD